MAESSQVWKFPLKLEPSYRIELPVHHTILTAQRQGANLVLWAKVEPSSGKMQRRFYTIATGEPFDPAFKEYVATVQYGELVWHIFAQPNRLI